MRHIISILLENESGALSRVAGLFSARAYNIESLTVAPTDDSTLSRMTIVTSGTEEIIEQINKQLNKLIDVVKLHDLTQDAHIERELMLIKVQATNEARDEVKRLVEIFRGHIIDVTDTTYTIDRKSTRLNSSHRCISYAVFCLKTKQDLICTLLPENEKTTKQIAKKTQ